MFDAQVLEPTGERLQGLDRGIHGCLGKPAGEKRIMAQPDGDTLVIQNGKFPGGRELNSLHADGIGPNIHRARAQWERRRPDGHPTVAAYV